MALGWVGEQFVEAIDAILTAITDFLYTLIAEFLGLLEFFILRTPSPTCDADFEGHVSSCQSAADYGRPIIFETPPEGLSGTAGAWHQMYTIFESTQPYGILMLFFAAAIGSFVNVFYGIIPNSTRYSPQKLRKRLVLGFILITFWWYLAIFMLTFADAFTNLLANAGAASSDESGLAMGYALLMEFLEQATGDGAGGTATQLGVTIVIAAIFVFKLFFLLILLLIWIMRLFILYLGIPLMPLFIGMWAFHLPGFGMLNTIGEKALNWFAVLAFVSIPGGIFIGFSSTVLEVVLEIVTSNEESGSEFASNTGNCGSGQQYHPEQGCVSTATGSPTETTDSIVINSGSVTDGGSVGSGVSKSEILADQLVANTATADVSTTALAFGLAFGIGIAVAIPFIAAAGPFLMVVLADGNATSLISKNPGSALMNQAARSRGKAGLGAQYLQGAQQKAFGGQQGFGNRGEFSKEDINYDSMGEDVDSWEDLSSSQKAKKRFEQGGLVSTAGWGSQVASKEVQDNYQKAKESAPDAYVKGRAFIGNEDYRKGLINESKESMKSTVSAKIEDRDGLTPSIGEKREEMAQRINNAKSRHEQLVDKSRSLDYKDAAEAVDGSTTLSEKEKFADQQFGEIESREEMRKEAEKAKQEFEEVVDRIENAKEERGELVTDELLDQKRDAKKKKEIAEEMAYDWDATAGESPEGKTKLEKVQDKVAHKERSEKLGFVDPDTALGGSSGTGFIKVEREAERGSMEVDEIEEALETTDEQRESLEETLENLNNQLEDSETGTLQSRRVKGDIEDTERKLQDIDRQEEKLEQALEERTQLNQKVDRLGEQLEKSRNEVDEELLDPLLDRMEEKGLQNSAELEADLESQMHNAAAVKEFMEENQEQLEIGTLKEDLSEEFEDLNDDILNALDLDLEDGIEEGIQQIEDLEVSLDSDIEDVIDTKVELEATESELTRTVADEARSGSARRKVEEDNKPILMVNREQNEQEFRENVQGETLMNEMFESESGDIGVDSAQVEALDDLYQTVEQTEQFDEQELEANPREGISWNEA